MLTANKRTFIELALHHSVLQLGEFTLKSGRLSPYFFNAGRFHDGDSLAQLGQCYAQTLLESSIPCDHLFGPAYKGLPIATATAIALSKQGINKTVTFNRKEVKDHGEGGMLIGAPLTGNVVMLDDVITAGTAFRETLGFIQHQGATLSGVVIALNRLERGQGPQSAVQEIQAQGIQVASIITVLDLVDYLREHNQTAAVNAILHYYEKYGQSV